MQPSHLLSHPAARYVINLLKVFLYLIILFTLCRLSFLLYFHQYVASEGNSIYLLSLWKAFPLDLSTISYLSFIPALFFLIGSFFFERGSTLLTKIYLTVVSVVYIIIAIAEIGVYQEVHVKLYFNLLSHLKHIDELFQSVSFSLMITILTGMAAMIWLAVILLNKLFPKHGPDISGRLSSRLLTFIPFLLSIPLLVFGCRGGLQPIPINEGEVYFSKNQCVNDATVNPLWNIGHSFVENKLVLKGDVYKTMPDEEAEAIVRKLYEVNADTTVSIFKTAKPNICFIILESWSADVIASLGGYEGLTPNFEKLIHQGYVFTQIKPAGHVSDQGIPAVLSGYPALPIGSAINQPERQVKLPSINNQLKNVGYQSSFFFGGQLIFGNIKAYIFRNGFDRVAEQKDLPATLPSGRLGIHDSLMLSIWHDSIQQMRQPFFTCLFTLSSHSPFDAPAPKPIDWGGYENPYLNSIVYADRQLGHFFERVQKEPWYSNTVFVMVADHSHNVPKNYEYCTPEFYHIPLLICGGALRDEFRGKRDERVASQTDIASTLLHQLHLPSGDYRWSKNLLNPATQRFAFYTFNEGFGFVDSTGAVVWNKRFPRLNTNSAKTKEEQDVLLKKGAAMLQTLMKDFLSK